MGGRLHVLPQPLQAGLRWHLSCSASAAVPGPSDVGGGSSRPRAEPPPPPRPPPARAPRPPHGLYSIYCLCFVFVR